MRCTPIAAVIVAAATLPGIGTAHAEQPHKLTCTYVRGLHSVIVDLNGYVNKIPRMSRQQARSQGLTLLLREASYDRKTTPLPKDLADLVGSTVQRAEVAADYHKPGTPTLYNRFRAQAARLLGATWASYRRHYDQYGCKGAK